MRSSDVFTDPVHFFLAYGGFFYLSVTDENPYPVSGTAAAAASSSANPFVSGSADGAGAGALADLGQQQQQQQQQQQTHQQQQRAWQLPCGRWQAVVSASTIAPAIGPSELRYAGLYFHPPKKWNFLLTTRLDQVMRVFQWSNKTILMTRPDNNDNYR
jgi:hypothetical protein